MPLYKYVGNKILTRFETACWGLADVLEHVREPERLLEEIRTILVPRGVLIASVPNFGHWYPRGRTILGLFDYDQRGILDPGHVRLFMRRDFLARLRHAGFMVVRQEATGLPLEVLPHGDGAVRRTLRRGLSRGDDPADAFRLPVRRSMRDPARHRRRLKPPSWESAASLASRLQPRRLSSPFRQLKENRPMG